MGLDSSIVDSGQIDVCEDWVGFQLFGKRLARAGWGARLRHWTETNPCTRVGTEPKFSFVGAFEDLLFELDDRSFGPSCVDVEVDEKKARGIPSHATSCPSDLTPDPSSTGFPLFAG